jgi:glyoxalase family protein
MTISGLHHITLGCSSAAQTVAFYTKVLGLRFVKKTVNFDDPSSYHLYFGNDSGAPGTAITFFEWPNARAGHPGIGGTHHFALRVPDYDTLLKWKRRLTDVGIAIDGPLDRHYFVSIYFQDPDGTIIEIATDGPGFSRDEASDQLGQAFRAPPEEMVVRNRDEARIRATTWPEPVPEIEQAMTLAHGMHHITAIGTDIQTTHRFFNGLLGLELVKQTNNFDDPDSAHWYWGTSGGSPGSLITYFERDPASRRRVQIGVGQTHHFAFAVPDETTQLQFRERLLSAGLAVSPVMDRVYFKSIYTQDPDGHVVELATQGPGFAVDEAPQDLGKGLMLPSWLEGRRAQIEAGLSPIGVP